MKLEENLSRLSELSEVIENPESTLDESVKAFEQSLEVAEQCMKQLKEYKGKLTVLENKLKELSDEE